MDRLKNGHSKPITKISRRSMMSILLVLCSVLVASMLIVRSTEPSKQLDTDRAVTVEMPALAQHSTLNEPSSEQSSTSSRDKYDIWNYGMAMGLQHEQDQTTSFGSKNTSSSDNEESKEIVGNQNDEDQPVITVLLTDKQIVERVPLEQYVLQVTLAEVPNSFETEAIKAQMLAVRTYIVRRMMNSSNMEQHEPSGEQYIVTDTQQHQVYWSNERMLSYQEDKSNKKTLEKFEHALEETKDQILVYKQEPIEAVFFSTSNGYTEAAEDYWGYDIEYLQSVESKWDQSISPSYEQEVALSYEQLYQLLGLSENNNDKLNISDVVHTDSKRIANLSINGQTFEGKQLRELLGLASTHFTWTKDNKAQTITFTTYGYGHGVGMSQWGANGMAQEGYLAKDIVTYYYKGVHIEQASKLVKNY
ncbi:stage II sporulation protein D [Paenibacillus endoradicis]|uniref:stage II sporulation protein D n=1 Tax=Paenibacillus endoradicis TaxID=2972487 RepID=UPI0021595A6A|nr:stage II sporulation protein D [Paenibacillus endoradicis]MCR8660473.1 stage II sporulation protein D [Paenibacillus endoradicis]